ncbi:MAG: MFS transporter, partial [Bauldia sp.]|nr:MFS transporter [Bauldia sp.]
MVLIAIESVISAFSYPYFSLALEKYGLSNWLIGLNASFAGAGILFVGPFLPRLIAVIGLSRFAAAMYALPFLCFAAIFAFDNVVVWFASRFVMGACFAALWATTEIWLNGVVNDRQRGRAMSLAMVLYTGAQFVGPLMISATGVIGFWPFVLAMIPLAAGTLIALSIRDRPSSAPEDSRMSSGGLGFRAAFSLAKSLIIASFLVGVASTAIYSLLPLFGVAQGLSDEAASSLVAIFSLGEAVLVGVVGILADRYGRWKLLQLCAIPTLAIAIALPFVANVIPALA